ncbi:MAG: hypothetical protein C0507_01095 [Cyanobacteria bacterium PR.3.49]|nr:hypothetical protein [Cyanobacteria bacterium PR.3.49]
MKNKPAKVLSSLFAFGIAAGAAPAYADKAAVETAEASVKMFEQRAGTNNPSYVNQLMYLANVYLSNDREKDAEIIYNKALLNLKSKPDRKAEVPRLMLDWAMMLASNKNSQKEKAEKVMLDGLQLANELPAASKERINYLIGTINFYNVIGKSDKKQARIKAADEHLASLEKNEKLTNEDITNVAANLVKLAEIQTFPMPVMRFRFQSPVFHVVPDNSPDKPNTVKEREFKSAEGYQLRAIRQYDRLPETVPWRIEAHRKLILWYRSLGQTKQEEFQTQQLSKLMNTTDRDKLFPQPAPCPACGMG